MWEEFTGAEILVKAKEIELDELNKKIAAVQNEDERNSLSLQILASQAELASRINQLKVKQREWSELTKQNWTTTGFLSAYLKENAEKEFNQVEINDAMELVRINALYRAHLRSLVKLLIPEATDDTEKQIAGILEGEQFTNVKEARNHGAILKLNQDLLKKIEPVILSLNIEEEETRSVPVLGWIPLLGKVFEYKVKENKAAGRYEIIKNILVSNKAISNIYTPGFLEGVIKNLQVGLFTNGDVTGGVQVTLPFSGGNIEGPIVKIQTPEDLVKEKAEDDYQNRVLTIIDQSLPNTKDTEDKQGLLDMRNEIRSRQVMNTIGGDLNQEKTDEKASQIEIKQESNPNDFNNLDGVLKHSREFNLKAQRQVVKMTEEEKERNSGTGVKIGLTGGYQMIKASGWSLWLGLALSLNVTVETDAKAAD